MPTLGLEAEVAKIVAAIGCMLTSVPESVTMEVYNSLSSRVGLEVPAILRSTVILQAETP